MPAELIATGRLANGMIPSHTLFREHSWQLTVGAEALEIYGDDYPTPDGTCVRDFVHVDDLADAHIVAADYLAKEGVSSDFNIGSGQGHSVREVIQMVEEVTGKSVPHRLAPRREGDPPVLVADISKARQILKWKPHASDLQTIVSTAWDWYRKERKDD